MCWRADYVRFCGCRARDLCTPLSGPHAAAQLPRRHLGQLNAKLHPILLDTALNGAQRVALNIVEMAAFAACKLGAAACCGEGGSAPRPGLLARCASEAADYVAAGAGKAARGGGGAFCIPKCASSVNQSIQCSAAVKLPGVLRPCTATRMTAAAVLDFEEVLCLQGGRQMARAAGAPARVPAAAAQAAHCSAARAARAKRTAAARGEAAWCAGQSNGSSIV